jgi:branched-chain amino acid aminotransferase
MKEKKNLGESIVYIDGKYLAEARAKISVFDHIVLYGDGVYDTCCAWAGRVFKLDQHINRFFESAKAVAIEIPLSKSALEKVVLTTVRKNRLREAYIKIIVTRGVGEKPLLSPYNCRPSLIVFAKPFMKLAGGEMFEKGITIKTSSLRKIPPECWDPRIKATNYLNHVLMRYEANEAGADDALELGTDGYVAEAPGYNVFVVKKEILYTPDENILKGITRETIIELAAGMKIKVVEGRITPFDFYTADEAFFCSTAGGIFPVVKIDGRVIGDGKAGFLTKRFNESYFELLESGKQSSESIF